MHRHAPQLFNFFTGYKHMMHGHHNFNLLLCWQTHDVRLQLLNCFLVEKHHKFQPWRKQLLNSFLMNTQHVDSTSFNWSCTKSLPSLDKVCFHLRRFILHPNSALEWWTNSSWKFRFLFSIFMRFLDRPAIFSFRFFCLQMSNVSEKTRASTTPTETQTLSFGGYNRKPKWIWTSACKTSV